MNNVLIYIRPFSKQLFTDIVVEAIPNARITYVSDYRDIADIWVGSYIYDPKYEYYNESIEINQNDIISRDRVLRKKLSKHSKKIVNRFWNGVDELLKKHSFDYFVTLNVDCYSIDILLRLAEQHGIKSISFLGSFLDGYAWFNLRGERNPLLRKVSNEEANRIYLKLTNNKFLPKSETKNVEKNYLSIYKYYYRRMIIEKIYYPLMRFIKRDKWNYFYNLCLLEGKRFNDFFNNKFEFFFKRVNELTINRYSVYFPMHLIPEATTDYWCEGIAKIGYDNYVCNIIENSSPEIIWLIKEHPAMYGKRELSFYERLNKYNNVEIVHPLERSNELLELVDNVAVDNGTVGVEALIRNKRVFSFSENYYAKLHPNIKLVENIQIDIINFPLVNYDNVKFIKDLLDGLFVSDYKNDKLQSNCNKEQLVEGIKMLIQSKGWD